MVKTLSFGLVFSLLFQPVFGEEISHPFLLNMSKVGVVVEQSDSLPVLPGLTAWLVTSPDGQSEALFYTTENQEYILSVEVSDHNGADPVATWLASSAEKRGDQEALNAINETLGDAGEAPLVYDSSLQQFISEKPVNQEGDLAWKALSETLHFSAVEEDNSINKILYVFVDPHCVACANLWPHLERYRGQGIDFRIVPVVFLNPEEGYKKITSMAMTADPYSAYGINEVLFTQGGFPGVEQAHEGVISRVDLNFKLLNKLGIEGTPAIVYQDEEGKTKVSLVIDDQFFQSMGGASR